MRATRAYLAGIGTAGALALGAALVFAAASAIIAFRGWPGANSSAGPARQVVSVTPPPSPVARRLAQIATTARRAVAPAPHHPAASIVTRIPVRNRTTTATRVHHGGHAVIPTHHRAASTPRVIHHRAHHVHRAIVHTRHTRPLHSKSYPASTPSPTTTTGGATTPAATAPTVTTAVTTATTTATTTPTTIAGITVPTGRGHSVTITTPTTPPTTPTTPTGPINIRPVTNTTETTTVTITPTVTAPTSISVRPGALTVTVP